MSIARLVGQYASHAAVPQPLRWFYASVILRRASDALLLIIGPLFVYQLGPRLFPVSHFFPTVLDEFTAGIAALTLVLIVGRVSHLLIAQPLAVGMRRLGLKPAILFGQLARILMLVLYSFAGFSPNLIWPATLLWGIVLGWYFPAYHLYLAEKLEVGRVGRELGTLEILIKLALVVTPLIGTFFYTIFGFQDSYLLSVVLILASTLCLWNMPNIRFRTTWQWSDFRDSWKEATLRRQWIGLGAKAWEENGLGTFLPIFLFLLYQNVIEPGYIFTSASLFSLIVVYLAGLKFDTSRNKNWILFSGAGSAIFWIGRFFLAPFPILLVLGETLERFSSSFFSLSFFAELIQRIRQKNPIIYVHNREVLLDLAHIIGGILLLALLLIHWSWLVLFLSFAATGVVSLVFVKPIFVKPVFISIPTLKPSLAQAASSIRSPFARRIRGLHGTRGIRPHSKKS